MKPQDLRKLLQKKKEKQLLIDLIFIEHLKLRGELKEEHFDRIAMGIKKVFTNQNNRVEFNDNLIDKNNTGGGIRWDIH